MQLVDSEAQGVATRATTGSPRLEPVHLVSSHHELTLYPAAGPLFDALCSSIARAERRVWIETYICRDDAVGARLGEVLARAARRGLDVRLLYDPQGSWHSSRSFFSALARRGVAVRAYRPLFRSCLGGSYWPRDHGKLVIIDEDAYTGGPNVGCEWLPARHGGQGWHDVAVGLRGPVVDDFCALFARRWFEANSRVRASDFVGGSSESDVRLIGDCPATPDRIQERLAAAIDGAQHRVWIENAYCVPPAPITSALEAAAGRGIDVRLIVPGCSDLWLVHTAARGHYSGWLRAGLALFEYQPSVLHSKFAVIDGNWATVGSFNLMSVGACCANETNVVVRDTAFVAALGRVFEADLGKSAPMTLETIAQLPTSRRLLRRLVARSYRWLEKCLLRCTR